MLFSLGMLKLIILGLLKLIKKWTVVPSNAYGQVRGYLEYIVLQQFRNM